MIIMVVVRTNNIDGVDDTGDEEQQSEEAVEPEGASTALVEENGNGLKIKGVVRAITSVDSGAEPNCVLSIFVDFVSHRTSAGKRVWQLLTHSQKTGKPQ